MNTESTTLIARTDRAVTTLQESLHTLAAALGRVEAVSGGLLTDGDVWISPGTWGLWAQNLRAQLDGLQPLVERVNTARIGFEAAFTQLSRQAGIDYILPYVPVMDAFSASLAKLADQADRYELAYDFGHYLSTRVPDAL
jgi:hypothetical protein